MNYPIDLDVTPGGIPKIVKLSQYDKSIPVIVATLWEGSQAYTMPTGATCYVAGTKPDNTGFEYQVSNSGNVVTIPITEQMTAVAGRVPTEVIIMTSDGRKGSANFFLDVEPAALSEDTSLSETDIPIIEQLPEKLEEAKTYANKAHQWATYGSDSEQPSATNNAKYYAEQAAQTDIGQATTISEVSDTAPYLFRSSTANAEYDELVGVSVVENQLLYNNFSSPLERNGITFTRNNDGSVTVNGTSTARAACSLNTVKQNATPRHKYLILGCPSDASLSTFYIAVVFYQNTTYKTSAYATKDTVYALTNEEVDKLVVEIVGAESSGQTVTNKKFTPQIIDLTLAFGSSVADLIYSMEQATAGSGIAYLKSLGLLKDGYEAYNTGTMASSQPVSRVVRGKNLLNKSNLEKGNYNSENFDLASAGSDVYRSIKVYVKAGTYTYSWGKNITMSRLVKDGVMSTALPININTYTVTVNADGYLGISWRDATSSSIPWEYDTPIQLEIGSTATDYEPYKEVTYPLGSDTLRGLLTVVNNKIVANGDVKTSDGVITRKSPEIDLGSLTYTRSNASGTTDYYFFHAQISDMKTHSDVLTSKYAYNPSGNTTAMADKDIITGSQNNYIYIRDDSYTDATTFKTAMNGVKLVYELATPTTEQSTPFAYPQVVMDTEEIVSDIPCGHNAKYVTLPSWMDKKIINDLVAEATKVADIEEALPSKVEESNIAPVENGSTASTSYSVGALIMRNGTLYKVISNIASGGTFTVGTNIQATTLADVIASL